MRPWLWAPQAEPRGRAVIVHVDDSRSDIGEDGRAQTRTVGRYVVLGRIGTGGMGVVYLAYDPELDRRVAVKVLRADRARSTTSEVYRERLWREAQTLARLSHPSIVRVFDLGEHHGRLFVAMEYLEGASLRRWLAAARRDFAAIWPIFAAAAAGLQAAHDAGIVHRDFKPDNVVVCDDGRVVVLDFGIARAGPGELDPADVLLGADAEANHDLRPLTHPGRAMGTPSYMAPEQHLGDPLDGRSDEYAWCVALWESLAGIRPFVGRPSAMLERKISAARSFDGPVDGLPKWIVPVLRKGLAIRSADRYGSMSEIVDAIERARPRPRRWIVPVAVAAFVATVGALVIGARRADVARCEAASERLAESWNDDRREAIQGRFAGSGVPYALGSWALVRTRIDDFTARWQASWRPACAAVSAGDRGSGPEVACLDRALRRLVARIDVIADATPEVIENVTRVVADLAPPERCANDPGIGADDPDDVSLRERVDALRVQLAAVEALELAGRYDQGLERGDRALVEAERLGHSPATAEARLLVGRLHKALGGFERAKLELSDAAWMATAVRHDEVAARAMIELVVVVGRDLGDVDGGMTWADAAEVAIGRAGGDELLEAGLLNNIGLVQFRQGRFEEARRGDALALEIRERILGREHPVVATSHNNLGSDLWMLGRHSEAEVELRRAIAIHEAANGPDHPRLAASLDNLGALLAERGAPEQARPLIERALDIRERALGLFHPSLADTLVNLGVLHAALGEQDLAESYFERARGVIEGGVGREHPTMATCLSNLGGVQLARRDLEAARASFAEAVSIYERALGPDHVKVGLTLANLGEAERERGAYSSAEQVLTRSVDILERGLGDHPQLAYAIGRRGLVRLARGHVEGSIGDLERALRIQGEVAAIRDGYAELHFALARAVWRANGDRARALAEAAQASVDAGPDLRRRIDAFVADLGPPSANPGGPL